MGINFLGYIMDDVIIVIEYVFNYVMRRLEAYYMVNREKESK